MNDPTIQDSRRRLRELLSIPERDRTDAQWDEIIEIEITLAPGNRESDRPLDRSPDRRQGTGASGRRSEPRKPGPRASGNRQEPRPSMPKSDNPGDVSAEGRPVESRPPKRHSRRPRRPNENGGGAAGGNGGGNTNGNGGGGAQTS
ncbi:MAG TPA: hypothetical protein PK981_08145 [Accumulibacter sp.]|nr:hypothetical protein [Accumulibacter sp.]HMX22491.1 hypothetical protein [Accumulibacter sp.]HND80662.1 hypothetical protein [Accumulibacter sp.]HNE13329.1 hypothetical protein [Accumulibacter sp.]HNG39000.1 hypothetical protein [Accumulibacter sp.]